jgi:hypothetical protein
MLRIFKDGGKWAFELKQKDKYIVASGGYDSPGEIQDFISQIASVTTECFRSGNCIVEQ